MLNAIGKIPTNQPVGRRIMSNKKMFKLTGISITAASAAHKLKRNISPMTTSTAPKNGIKYPDAASPVKNAPAAPGGVCAIPGINFIAPNATNDNPVNIRIIV